MIPKPERTYSPSRSPKSVQPKPHPQTKKGAAANPKNGSATTRKFAALIPADSGRGAGIAETTGAGLEVTFQTFAGGRLSPREQMIVSLILRGHSSASIANRLVIAEGTVKNHRKNIYAKLAISSQTELGRLLRAAQATVVEDAHLGHQVEPRPEVSPFDCALPVKGLELAGVDDRRGAAAEVEPKRDGPIGEAAGVARLGDQRAGLRRRDRLVEPRLVRAVDASDPLASCGQQPYDSDSPHVRATLGARERFLAVDDLLLLEAYDLGGLRHR